MQALTKGMKTALLIVYLVPAVVFRPYLQPAMIMTAIPFGIVGAVIGHLIMGYSLSLISFFGIVALSGVVVNDSLVLIDLANRKQRLGQSGYAAVVNAAVARFRPILLTTLTTFFRPHADDLRDFPPGPVSCSHGYFPWLRHPLCHRHHPGSGTVPVPDPARYTYTDDR
jgi:hypothetical protein